jgi:serine/threonine protein kinase
MLNLLKSLSEEYVINPQDELGSGQFGQVYGGLCKTTKQRVAIKVIDKTRFQDFQTETSIFQNEITILYNVQHPGIVKLHALFDEGNHVIRSVLNIHQGLSTHCFKSGSISTMDRKFSL